MIEASPDEVVFLMLTLFGQGKEQLNFSIMDNVSKDQVLKIHQFFEEALCSWTKLIKDIAGNDSQTKIEVNEPTLTTLWGSLCCCPHFQLQENNLLAMHDFIINLNQLLETNSGKVAFYYLFCTIDSRTLTIIVIFLDSIAGLSKFTWQSLLGASLESYYKVLLLDRNKLVETCDILDFAKRHKNSPHVLSAVAEILDSVFGYGTPVLLYMKCSGFTHFASFIILINCCTIMTVI